VLRQKQSIASIFEDSTPRSQDELELRKECKQSIKALRGEVACARPRIREKTLCGAGQTIRILNIQKIRTPLSPV
jgi:hypothetical protein